MITHDESIPAVELLCGESEEVRVVGELLSRILSKTDADVIPTARDRPEIGKDKVWHAVAVVRQCVFGLASRPPTNRRAIQIEAFAPEKSVVSFSGCAIAEGDDIKRCVSRVPRLRRNTRRMARRPRLVENSYPSMD